MPATLTELLPPTPSDPHGAIRWTPCDPDAPVLVDGLPAAGELEIQGRRNVCKYAICEFPTGWDGRGFRFTKTNGDTGSDATEIGYSVFVARNGQDRQCDCRGFQRWGHCRHLAAMEALITNGWL